VKAAAMSAGLWGLAGTRKEVLESPSANEQGIHSLSGWSRGRFEQEQIRGLVRQVFSPRLNPPVRQIVFSAVEPETEVSDICRKVAEALAAEVSGDVVVVGARTDREECVGARRMGLRESAKQVRRNLWLAAQREVGEEGLSTASLHAYLAEIRREFEYSIVAAPAAGESNEAQAMAQFADGMILVLSAKNTRRVTALKVKEMLAQVRILGTVLTDREFPIPEGIYRRL